MRKERVMVCVGLRYIFFDEKTKQKRQLSEIVIMYNREGAEGLLAIISSIEYFE